jgi:CRP/FNR family nitrogen fixation transcriptional regulator
VIRHAAQFQPHGPLLALGTVKHFTQDQALYREGDPASYFMQLMGGVVRSVYLQRDGRRFIEAFHMSGDVFGMEAGAHYAKSAEAVCPCSAVFYPLQDIALLNAGKDGLSWQVFDTMQRELQQARDHARLLSRANAWEKTGAFLLEYSSRAGGWPLVTLAMTRQDIGDYLGLTVETVSRTLAQLHRAGLIEMLAARSIRLLDIPALREMTV